MQQLRRYQTEAELQEAYNFFASQHPRAKCQLASCLLQKFLPGAVYILYTRSDYWLGIKKAITNVHIQAINFNEQFNEDDYKAFVSAAFQDGLATEHLLDSTQITIMGDYEAVAATGGLLISLGGEARALDPTLMFSYSVPLTDTEYKLPTGYSLDTLHPEDAHLVASTWAYASPSEVENIKFRCENLATLAVRAPGGKLAGFAMLEHNGMIIHAFVLPEYRGQRLRDAIFHKLALDAQRKFGIEPYFCVVKANTTMLKWVLDEKRQHVTYVFQRVFRTNAFTQNFTDFVRQKDGQRP